MDKSTLAAVLSSTVIAAVIGIVTALIAFFPSRTAARAAARKVEIEAQTAANEEERKRRDELRAERDRYHALWAAAETARDAADARADQIARELAERRLRCVNIGEPCVARQPAPTPLRRNGSTPSDTRAADLEGLAGFGDEAPSTV